jgi:hypothetical protein
MKLKIILFVFINLLFLISLVNASFYYDVKMNYSNGKVQIDSIDIIFSHFDISSSINDSDSYVAKVNDEEIYFKIHNYQLYDTIDNQTGDITGGGNLTTNNFEIIIPYSGSGKTIDIYNPLGEKIESKSLIEYSRLYTKKEYSKLNNDTEIKNIENEPNTEVLENNNLKNTEEKTYYSWIIIIALIAILACLIIYYFTRLKIKKKR